MTGLLPRLPLIPLGLALMVGACAVFNPNHVPLNPFTKPNPCFQVYAQNSWDTGEDQAEQDAEDAWIARHQRDLYWSPKCQEWRLTHPKW